MPTGESQSPVRAFRAAKKRGSRAKRTGSSSLLAVDRVRASSAGLAPLTKTQNVRVKGRIREGWGQLPAKVLTRVSPTQRRQHPPGGLHPRRLACGRKSTSVGAKSWPITTLEKTGRGKGYTVRGVRSLHDTPGLRAPAAWLLGRAASLSEPQDLRSVCVSCVTPHRVSPGRRWAGTPRGPASGTSPQSAPAWCR